MNGIETLKGGIKQGHPISGQAEMLGFNGQVPIKVVILVGKKFGEDSTAISSVQSSFPNFPGQGRTKFHFCQKTDSGLVMRDYEFLNPFA